jgi:hypothetical protein
MRIVRGFVIALLIFLALTALAGSIPMILQPGGNPTSLPLAVLAHSPFRSYLIPGLLLFIANGVLAILVLAAVVRRTASYAIWTGFQGCVLLVWLLVECWLLRTVIWLHYFYGMIAALLVAGGLFLRHRERPRASFTGDTQPGRR